ncbi:MAG: hypothetical protein GEU81_06830 [Nitriliruptorales bacterium]|nr:hypothetical protein [Nitriliruptorales bacterium]
MLETDGLGRPETDALAEASFTRRVKALARTLPVHDLEAGKGGRDGDWSGYDLRGLALAAVDAVIDHMGLEFGATAAQVRERVAQLARAAVPQAPPRQADVVANAVLEALLNDRARREAFAVGYSDWSGPQHRRAQLVFKLLEEVEAPDGSVVLRATDEAVNFFVGALDRDVEDAQAAAEAVLLSQLRRGRIDAAVATAREARLRSVQFAAKVRRVLDATRRDVRQVDWGEDVPRLLDAAVAHLSDRLDVERHLLATLRTTLEDVAEGRRGGDDEGADAAASAARLLDLVSDCQSRHLELHEQLLSARSTFLAEQDRQRFAPVPEVRLVGLDEELLKPLFQLTARDGEPVAAAFLPGALGPVPPRLLRPVDLVEALLQPRRAGGEAEEEAPEVDLVGNDVDPWRFSPAARDAAEQVFAAVDGSPVRLSRLLADARFAGTEATDLIVLTALHAFAPEGPGALRAADDGQRLDDPDYAGVDLLVQRAVLRRQE